MSTLSKPAIFVCGASGTQGGAVTSHLLNSDTNTNATVHAIARDVSSERNQALAAAGVLLTPGSFDDEDSLRAAMNGCTELFLNLAPNLADANSELNQAKRILSIAKEVGIQHVVYSSGMIQGVEDQKYWDATSFVAKFILGKIMIEEAVRSAGFKHYTILRPGNFMTNYLAPHISMYPGLVEKGEYSTALTRDTILPMVDPNDIGRFGAAALLDPVRFDRKEVSLASQLMTLDEVLDAISKAIGRNLKANYLTDEEIDAQKGTNPFLGGQLLMRGMADGVNMDEVRSWGIPIGNFDRFLEREGERLKKTFSVQEENN